MACELQPAADTAHSMPLALSPEEVEEFARRELSGTRSEQQWLCHFVPSEAVLEKHAAYTKSNFSAGRANPPPQLAPSSGADTRAALAYAAHSMRSLLGHLIPNNQYNRFFEVMRRAALAQKRPKGRKGREAQSASREVEATAAIVAHIFEREAENADMAFAAEALRRLQRLAELEGNEFADGIGLPPLHHKDHNHVIRKICPYMRSFGFDHGDVSGVAAVIRPSELSADERALYERGELLLNARLIGGQGQSTFVQCPLGGWRLYARAESAGGYVTMGGELRFQVSGRPFVLSFLSPTTCHLLSCSLDYTIRWVTPASTKCIDTAAAAACVPRDHPCRGRSTCTAACTTSGVTAKRRCPNGRRSGYLQCPCNVLHWCSAALSERLCQLFMRHER